MADEQRAALVSGAGTGIGRASAVRLAEAGYGVALVGRRPGPLDDVADEITASGGRAVTVSADVGTPEGSARALTSAVAAFGRLDTLVCNHGVGTSAAVGDDTPEDWDSTIRINLTGPFLLARAALPHLIETRGSIVNISSTSGWLAGPASASYCTSKAGLIMLTRCLATDYGPQGVRANCVCPGVIDTPMASGFVDQADDPTEVRREYEALSPLKRLGTPREIANCILFLASDEASFVTGTTLVADGGTIIQP